MAPIYDFNTSNKSFLYLHRILKDLNVKNNFFFLRLNNPALQGIDLEKLSKVPDTPDVINIKRAVIKEAAENVWYYFRECWRLKTEDGGFTRFRLDIHNLAIIWLQSMSINTYSEKPRQTGKTIGDTGHLSHSYGFGARSATYGVLNYSDEFAKENLARVLRQLDSLPDFLKLHKYKTDTDKRTGDTIIKDQQDAGKSIKSVYHGLFDNRLVATTYGTTPESANKAGKGGTMAILYMDEVAVAKYFEIVMGAAAPAQSTAGKIAARANMPNYMALSSTPPDVDTQQGTYLYETYKMGSLKFEVEMFDWTKEEFIGVMRKNYKSDFVFVSFQYYELGYDENWAEDHYRKLPKRIFLRDILLRWMKDFKYSPYRESDLETLQTICDRSTSYIMKMKNYFIFKWFSYNGMTPQQTQKYFKYRQVILAIDVGSGTGGDRDNSTIDATCVETGKTIGQFVSNEADPILFANLIAELVNDYLPHALVVIERNSYGKAVCDVLKRTNIRSNLYYTDMSEDMIKKGMLADTYSKSGKKPSMFGIFNQAKIREQLFDVILNDVVVNKKRLIVSPFTAEEISTLTVKNNKIQARVGFHDDSVIAKLFALWVLFNDRSLESNFGIKNLSLHDDSDEEMYINNMVIEKRKTVVEQVLEEHGGVLDSNTFMESLLDVHNTTEDGRQLSQALLDKVKINKNQGLVINKNKEDNTYADDGESALYDDFDPLE